jgi:hypothetical protein
LGNDSAATEKINVGLSEAETIGVIAFDIGGIERPVTVTVRNSRNTRAMGWLRMSCGRRRRGLKFNDVGVIGESSAVSIVMEALRQEFRSTAARGRSQHEQNSPGGDRRRESHPLTRSRRHTNSIQNVKKRDAAWLSNAARAARVARSAALISEFGAADEKNAGCRSRTAGATEIVSSTNPTTVLAGFHVSKSFSDGKADSHRE